MKKKLLAVFLSALLLLMALPVYAAVDPNVETVAYIDWSQQSSTKIRGKAYAITSNPNLTLLNVQGTFYKSNVQQEQGTGSTKKKNTEAYWFTKDNTYPDTGSYSLNVASRTYYSGGSYDQDYASASW